MTTHQLQSSEGVLDSREDMGVGSSEKSYGPADVSNTASGDKEQGSGNAGSQDAVAAAAAGEGNAVVERKADVPPNGGYGWVCVAACATINAYVFSIPPHPP